MPLPTELEAQLDDLYQGDPDHFVAERGRLAETVRLAGDELGAARIRRLPKPTVSAYWVNQVAHRWPEELAQLLALGAELRAATGRRDRAALVQLDRQRRVRTDALLSLLWHFGEDEGEHGRRRPSAESLTRVNETLTAAVMDEETAIAVTSGRLGRTAVHEGFGLVDGPDASESAEWHDGEPGGRAPTRVTHLPIARPRSEPGREAQLQRATSELVDAEQRLHAATDTVDSLTTMLAGIEHEIAALENDRDATQERLETWQRALRDADRVARAARRRLDALTGEE